jgi:hypothetical protein
MAVQFVEAGKMLARAAPPARALSVGRFAGGNLRSLRETFSEPDIGLIGLSFHCTIMPL